MERSVDRDETSPMPRGAPKLIVNLTRGGVVCEQAMIADGAFSRMRGLLGREALAGGEGLLLRPAGSIHTAFMNFPIDAVFIDRNLRVVRIVERLAPWHAAAARTARAVLEVGAGESARSGLGVGDVLGLLDQPARDPAADGRPIAVLLETSDRRFRSVAGALLSGRGWSFSAGDGSEDVTERAQRTRVDVLVIDATRSLTAAARLVAKVQARHLPIGIVVVSGATHDGLQTLPVLAKWGPFDDLCAAIEQAHRDRSDPPTALAQR